jgi:hypothetical protein
MLRRVEVRTWQHVPNPPMPIQGISVAIVVGGRESRPHGEGPQLVGSLVATLLDVKAWESLPMSAERERGSKSNRRRPCAVKVARTVTTGGMERRVARYRALSLPTLAQGTGHGLSGAAAGPTA